MKRIILSILFLLIFITTQAKTIYASAPEFITLIYPVRSRAFWADRKITSLDNIFTELKQKNFPSTWLIQYDPLKDTELVSKIKKDCPKCELGLFLEVSEDLATDSNVSYTLGEGHWYRPDKIFLSGYSLSDRVSLLDKDFETFKNIFGFYPKSVGVWYLDPFSQKYIAEKYGVTGVVSVADQYDTDGQRYWGRPWGVPYYSQKYSTQAEANNLNNKSNVVQLQWAQRHPTQGFGVGPKFSQFSLQANDYINNKKDTNFFKSLLAMYLSNPKNPFGQATIGLEVGQELSAFFPEHVNQLNYIKTLPVKVVTESEFSNWYRKTYPELSPKTEITDGKTTWVNTPTQRTSELDTRNYNCFIISKDILEKDTDTFIDREVGKKCDDPSNLELKIKLKLLSEQLQKPLAIFKWSTIDGAKIAGIQTGKETIFALWLGRGVGNFHFPFQTLSKFKTLGPNGI